MARDLNVRTEVYRLDELFRFIEQGHLRIPNFQRPYVWTPQDILDLLDSVDRGFPIGSVLIWRSEEQLDVLERFGPLALAPMPAERGTRMYLLDGHQRLATIFGALRLAEEAPRQDQRDWWWWVNFDPNAPRGRGRFFHAYPDGVALKTLPAQHIPMRFMLDSAAFLDWMDVKRDEARALKASGGKMPEGQLDPTRFVLEGQRLMSRLFNYKLPVFFVEGGDQHDAAQIFDRLNRKGVQLTEAQLQSALVGRGKDMPDLGANIISAKEQLRAQRFETLSDGVVLEALLATRGISPTRGVAANELPDGVLAATLASGLEGLKRAVALLRAEVGLPGARWLPSEELVWYLARRGAQGPLGESTRALWAEWCWVMALSGMLDRMTQDERERLVEVTDASGAGDDAPLRAYLDALRAQRLPPQFATQFARVRANLLIQRIYKPPRALDEGAPPLPESLLEDQLMQHHGAIFGRGEAGELYEDPGNWMWFRPGTREGSLLLSQDAQYIEDATEQREALASHGVDDAAWAALVKQDARAFINARRAVLERWEVEFLRARGLTQLADELAR